ncbi:serine/threonine-protein kinase [Limnoglobus roseus]|uniref:non-specific serine/threonine protein kinase n=1 Tax=Limnoglobus roseus TaxID=2598579 RepID=A0A5C1AP99_9BACT|nr:serine/threonine-protein kinase [Limnoglobus roseus]QEL20991.1 serine/threonine protein kinase [Limnoglobus roseus]
MPVTPVKNRRTNSTTRMSPLDPLDPASDETDYELSDSAILPANFQLGILEQARDGAPVVAKLDAEAQALFHQRLMLCCLVAAFPFFFFFISTLIGFIELFGRPVVGWTGVILSGTVVAIQLGVAVGLWRLRSVPETGLRVVEIAVFGAMGLFFAYWSFALLTADILYGSLESPPDVAARQEQYSVLAATLIVHFNWFALIVFHGVLVPNTLARGVGVITATVLAALLIDGIAVGLHGPTYRNKWVLFAVALTMLPTGAGLAIFGTAKTAALREEVQVAKQAVRELGQYRLRRKLGQGGMGEVYLAEHALLKRPCAVKRIHAKYLHNSEQVKRFEREVQITAQLRHPNTVVIFDHGRADDGTFYYVMEYLAGLSLEEIVNRHGSLPPERVVHLMRQVCGALREAHNMGLVHRDIKPSNIVVLPDGSPHDQAKLVDFGLVQSLTPDDDPEARITRDGLIVGTPEYMSPEQAQGMTLDERSDLYSLGSVMYFLLTGREAFHRENPVKTLLAVVNENAKPIAQVNPDVPADLAAVVDRCLAKSLEKRYAKAADLEAALARCGCAADWTGEQALAWWGDHPKADPTGTDLNSLPYKD